MEQRRKSQSPHSKRILQGRTLIFLDHKTLSINYTYRIFGLRRIGLIACVNQAAQQNEAGDSKLLEQKYFVDRKNIVDQEVQEE